MMTIVAFPNIVNPTTSRAAVTEHCGRCCGEVWARGAVVSLALSPLTRVIYSNLQ